MSEAERKKELVEALDAVVAEFTWYDSATGAELFADAVRRLLNADDATREEALRWVKRFE